MVKILTYSTVVDQDINGQRWVDKHVHRGGEDNHANSNDVVEVGASQSDQPVVP